MSVRKVVIPAAGMGTRLLPATKSVPKELFPLVDRPLIHAVVEEAVRSGIEDLVLVTSRGKAALEDYFDIDPALESFLERKGDREMLRIVSELSRMVSVQTVRQKEPLGLGHAVLCARDLVGREPFAVALPDDLIDAEVPGLAQLLALYGNTGRSVVALQEVPENQTHMYGIMDGRDKGNGVFEVESFVEKPPPGKAPSRYAVIGRYVLAPEVMDLLENQSAGAGGEIQLTDALNGLAGRGGMLGLVFEGLRHDAGDRLGLIMANIHYALKDSTLGPRLRRYMETRLAGTGE